MISTATGRVCVERLKELSSRGRARTAAAEITHP
jgi:hypothetical protein